VVYPDRAFFCQAEEGIRDFHVTGVQTCALPIYPEEVIWVAEDGTPGIELGFDVDLDGVRVRGYIDQVLKADSDDSVRVRDVKTGAQPGDALQLKVYAVALEDTYDVRAPTG